MAWVPALRISTDIAFNDLSRVMKDKAGNETNPVNITTPTAMALPIYALTPPVKTTGTPIG